MLFQIKEVIEEVTNAKLLEITEVDYRCQDYHHHQIQHLMLHRNRRVDLVAKYNLQAYKPQNIELKIASHCLYYPC